MGLSISSLFDSLFAKKPIRMLMIGLDGAGKTTILYKLKLGEVISTIPTIGFNVENVVYKNLSFTVWDIGGQTKIRNLWCYYYNNTDGIIFVIDACDRDRIKQVKEEFEKTLRADELRDAVILIFANKQDLPNSMSIAEIADYFQMCSFNNRPWHIQSTCALNGSGIYEGLEWLSKELRKR